MMLDCSIGTFIWLTAMLKSVLYDISVTYHSSKTFYLCFLFFILLRTLAKNKNDNPIVITLFAFVSLRDVLPCLSKLLAGIELFIIVELVLPVCDCWLSPVLVGLMCLLALQNYVLILS